MPRVLSDRAQAIERAKGLLRVRDQAPDDDDIQELLEQAFFAGSAVPAITPAELCREIINDAIRRELQEDAQDLAAFADRADEQTLSYEAFLAKPKADGTP